MKERARIVTGLARTHGVVLPVILCFFTGPPPAYAALMPRDPAPPLGDRFGEDFARLLVLAMKTNAAVHDGAVMIGRARHGAPYSIAGWSFRLFPPDLGRTAVNRGSAFNSCLAMSAVGRVDDLYLVTSSGSFRFANGRVEPLP